MFKIFFLPFAKLKIDSYTRGAVEIQSAHFDKFVEKQFLLEGWNNRALSEDLSKITKTKLTTAKSFRDRFVPFYTQFTKSELCNGS